MLLSRRRVLRLAAVTGFGAVLTSPLDVLGAAAPGAPVTAPNGVMYRGDRRGRIFASTDGGSTWALHIFLGAHYSVTRITLDRAGRVFATIGFRGRQFVLALAPDGKRWLTA